MNARNFDMCFICLEKYRALKSVHFVSNKNAISYAAIITLLTNILINNEYDYRICDQCQNGLDISLNFKKLIERSYLVLSYGQSAKRYCFDDFTEIKNELSIKSPDLIVKCEEKYVNLDEYINNINNQEITIKRTNNNDIEIELSSELNFLENIKCEDDALDDFVENNDSDSDYTPIKPSKLQQKLAKQNKEQSIKKSNIKYIICKNVKPKILTDLIVGKIEVPRVKKAIEKKIQKGKKRLICPICGKLFTSLKTHMLTHTGSRTKKCNLCERLFYTTIDLDYHVRSHSRQNTHKCDVCEATFPSKGAIIRHMPRHYTTKTFICEVCNKSFKRKSTLTHHVKRHNLNNKNVSCDQCSMTFFTRCSLKHHMRVHTGERPFKCEICRQPYSYKHDFNRHCYNKHGILLISRNVRLLDEKVLAKEKIITKELLLDAQSQKNKDSYDLNFPFGQQPLGVLAYENAIKWLKKNHKRFK